MYAYTTLPGTLVLQVPTQSVVGNAYNYKFFRTSQIKDVTVLRSGEGDSDGNGNAAVAEIHPIDVKSLPRIIQKNKDAYALVVKTRNEQASREGQIIFNTLYKTMPSVRWSGNSIVVLEEVKIDPPYTLDDIRGLHEDDDATSLVKKIVDGVWLKIESERKGG